MNPRQTLHRLASLTPIAATLSLLVPAHADTETWSGATNGTWDTSTANWLTDGSNNLFESADDALFTGTPANNVTAATGLTIGAITLDGTFTGSVTMSGPNTVSGATTISGGTLNLNHQTGLGGSAITVNSGGTVNVTLGSDQNVNNVFTGTGILTVSGSTGTPNFNNATALNGFTGTFNINTSGSKKVALTTAGGKIGSGATVNITSGGTLYIANTTASFDGVTFNVVGSGNTENLGAIRIENNSVIGATSSVVLGGNTSLGSNAGTGTINAAITQSTTSGLTKVAGQTLALGGANTYTGTTTISAGTLQLGTGGTTGSLSTSSAITNNATLAINRSNAVAQGTDFNSVISGTGTFVQAGTGTTTLSGANTYTGGTRANLGTLVLSGSHTKAAGTGDFLSVNNVGAQNAVLKIAATAGTQAYQSLNHAEATNARGAVYQEGGALSTANVFRVAGGTGSYGYYSLSGGTVTNTAGDMLVGSGNGSTGVMDVTAGSVTTGSWIVLGRNGGTASGLLNVTGGSVTSNSNNIALNWGGSAGAISVLNVGGGAGAASVTGVSNAANNLDVSVANVAGQTGVVNLRPNGTLTVAKVQAGGAASTALVNFNGGTLKATATNAGANFMNSGNMDAVTVYSGGGTIDNNGTNITIGNALGAATGNGVTSVAVTDGGSGYIGAPLVKFTDGTGNPATAYAVMADDGTGNGTFRVSSIVISSPGTYTVNPTTVTLTGGGASTAATLGSITTAANTSGGMTFTGAGTTTLAGALTFAGPITIGGGKLSLGGTYTQAVSVASGATLVVEDPLAFQGPLIVPAVTLPSGSIVNLEASGGSSEYVEATTAATGLSFDNISINLYEEGGTAPVTTFGTYTLFKYSGSFTGDEDTDITIANPVLGYLYDFNDTGTEITVTLSASDSDGDGLPNAWETANGLNPNDPNGVNGPDGNLDGDFATNLEEFQAGTAANNADDDPFDLDNDGLLDSWEVANFTTIAARDGTGDYDGDLATELAEFQADTAPKAADPLDPFHWPDSDTDSMNDAWEVKYFGTITAKNGTVDSDGDGATDLAEYQALSSPVDAAWSPSVSKLIHRWNFNGSYADLIASSAAGPDAHVNSTATVEDPNGATASSAVTLSATDVLLAGGASATSDYVKLGSNLLAGRATPATIEVWASHVSIQNWSRIFNFGSADTENLFMSWTNGTNAVLTRAEFRDYLTSTADTTDQPYRLNEEYHIVFTFEPGKGDFGANRVTCYVAPTVASGLGVLRSTFNTANNLANFTDTVAALGRSSYAGDATANARYNDVRIWLGNLPEAQREKLHDVGADSVDLTDTDGDGLLDAWELANFGSTTSAVATGDPDGDGFDNLAEQGGRSIPTLPNGTPSVPSDRDADQLNDDWEATYFANLAQTGSGDADSDGATNEQEETAATDPTNAASWPDTDGDLLKDAWEIQYFGDLDIDNDANNANDGAADFDTDGATDSQEFLAGTNPTLASSLPPSVVVLPATGTDAASDIATSKTYTHAIDFGATTAAVAVNGVAFHQASVPAAGNDGSNNDRWDSIDNTGGRSGAFRMDKSMANDWQQGNNNPANVGSDGSMAVILTDFSNLAGVVVGSTQTITLSGLTAGTRYSTRLYYRTWALAANRSTALTFNGDGNNAVMTFNPDQSATPESGYVKYEFTANDSDLTIVFGANVATNAWHQYALTNEVVPAGDGDNDGLPDTWENTHFGNTTSQTGAGDPDSDGTENRAEYLLGLSPVNGSQAFKATQSNVVPGTGVTLTWPAQNGLTFTVWRSTTLSGWTQLGGTVTATGATATYTDTTAPLGKAFYKVILTTP